MANNIYEHTPFKNKDKQQYAGKDELNILKNRSDTGWAVKTPDISASKSKTWNGQLTAPFGSRVHLWVSNIEMGFSLTGTTGQSRYRRQFFPRAMNQTSIILTCQMPNQSEYNKVAAFVRECHSEALTGEQSLYVKKANQLKKNVRNSSASLQTINLLLIRSSQGFGLRNSDGDHNIKGPHMQLEFQGYIKNIAAGAEKFNFAPELQFEFVIARSVAGVFSETLDLGSQLMNWTDQLRTYGFGQQKFASKKKAPKKKAEQQQYAVPAGPPTPAGYTQLTGTPSLATQSFLGGPDGLNYDSFSNSLFGKTK